MRFQFIGQPDDTELEIISVKHNEDLGGREYTQIHRKPNAKKGDGPEELTLYGYTFKKGGPSVEINKEYIHAPGMKPVPVELICQKLAANSHFKEVKAGRPKVADAA